MNQPVEFEQVTDSYTQENFRRLKTFLEESLFQGMALLELTFGKAETALAVPHGLAFAPQDVILTNIQGAGSFTVIYAQTTRQNIFVTTTGACVVRVLVGTFGGTQ